MNPLTILIDGYNVSRNMRGSRPEDGVALAIARDNLLAQVRARFRGTPHRVVVVFDGAGDREVCASLKGLTGGSQCIFTQRGVKADDVITELTARYGAAGEEVVVCTDDLDVRKNTAFHGATHAPVAALTQRLNAPDPHTEKRLRHSAFVRKQFEGEDGEPSTRPRKGNPRRAPKTPRGRGERLW